MADSISISSIIHQLRKVENGHLGSSTQFGFLGPPNSQPLLSRKVENNVKNEKKKQIHSKPATANVSIPLSSSTRDHRTFATNSVPNIDRNSKSTERIAPFNQLSHKFSQDVTAVEKSWHSHEVSYVDKNQVDGESSKVLEELGKTSSMLQGILIKATAEKTCEDAEIDKHIQDVIDMIPADILLKHGHVTSVAQRAMKITKKAILNKLHDFYGLAFFRWKRATADLRREERIAAATMINKIARSFLAKCRVFRVRRAMLDADISAAERLKAIQSMSPQQCAVMIQRQVRGFIARIQHKFRVRRHHAALFLTQFMRNCATIFHCKRILKEKKKCSQASLRIQKVYRGFKGRQRFKHFRVLRNRYRNQLRYASREELFKFFFEQMSSACKIQRWFRNLSWRRKLIWLRKNAKLVKALKKIQRRNRQAEAIERQRGQVGSPIGDEYSYSRVTKSLKSREQRSAERRAKKNYMAATVIAALVRGHLARELVKRMRFERNVLWTMVERDQRAAAVIQATGRRFLCRLRYPWIGARMRMLRRKEKNWLLRQQRVQQLIQAQVSAPAQSRSLSLAIALSLSQTHADTPGVAGTTSFPLTQLQLLRRRGGISFPNLVIGNIERIEEMREAVRKIQSLWMRYYYNLKKIRLVEQKRFQAILLLQRWARGLIASNFYWFLYGICEDVLDEKHHIKQSAIRITNLIRNHVRRKQMHEKMLHRRKCLLQLQRWMRCQLAMRKLRSKLMPARVFSEISPAGVKEYQRSLSFLELEYLWLGIRKPKYDAMHELQRWFVKEGSQGFIDSTKLQKVFKMCEGLLSLGTLSAGDVELQYMQVKAVSDKRIDYAQFVDLLANLAAIKFMGLSPSSIVGRMDEVSEARTVVSYKRSTDAKQSSKYSSSKQAKRSSSKGGGGGGGDEDVGGGSEPLSAAQLMINKYQYGRLVGKAALVTRFVVDFMTLLPEFQKSVAALKKLVAPRVALSHALKAIRRIQNFLLRRIVRKQWRIAYQIEQERKAMELIQRSARSIQGMVRGFLGKCMTMRLAQQRYIKYIDSETNLGYWYNPRTKKSHWKKPRLLGRLDCGLPIKIPQAVEQFVIPCSYCQDATANCVCDDCDDPFCAKCYESTHTGGKRKGHLAMTLSCCVQCEYQAGSRKCKTCNDIFCDTCYTFLHTRGRLRLHIFDWCCIVCKECDSRAAQWERLDPDSGLESPLCTVCHTYAYGPPEESRHTTKKIKFLGLALMEFRAKRDAERRKKELAEMYIVHRDLQQERRRWESAQTIQRVWRGRRAIRNLAGYLADRRAFFKLREEEKQVRESVEYKLKVALGIPTELKSDTTLERVKKMYPFYMQHILAAAIENDWSMACHLLREHEDFLHRIAEEEAARAREEQKLRRQERLAKFSEKTNAKVAAKVKVDGAEADAVTSGAGAGAGVGENQPGAATSTTQAGPDKKATLPSSREAQPRPSSRSSSKGKDKVAVAAVGGKPKKKSMWEKLRVEMAHSRAKRKLARAEAAVVRAVQQAKERLTAYQEARAVSSTADEVKQRLKARAAQAEKDVEAAKEKRDIRLREFDEAETQQLNFAGPRGLQRLVQEKRRTGQLMPFTVDVYTGCMLALTHWDTALEEEINAGHTRAHAKSSSGDSVVTPAIVVQEDEKAMEGEGKWRVKLTPGDIIFINGITFKLIRSRGLVHTFPKKGERATMGGSYVDEKDDDDDLGDLDSLMEQSVITPVQGEEGKEGEAAKAAQQIEAVPPEPERDPIVQSEDHLVLDRPWLLGDATGLRVYKELPSVFYVVPAKQAARALGKTFPVQKFVQIAATTIHKMALFNMWMASLFEEDSDTGASLRARAVRLEQRKDRWVTMSREMFDLSYDFEARRTVSSLMRSGYRTTKFLVIGIYALIQRTRRKNKETPFDQWNRSAHRESVKIVLELEDKEPVELGTFMMDIKAPCDILREYIRVYYFATLNETVGDSFSIFILRDNAKLDILTRKKEPRTYSKDYVTYKMDHVTMEGAQTITIMAERGKNRVVIPPPDRVPDEP